VLGESVEQSYVVAVTSNGTAAVISSKEKEIQPLKLGKDPRAAAALDRRIYVANFGSDSLSAFNIGSTNVRNIPLPAGAKPFDLARRPASPQLFVTQSGRGMIAIVDTSTDLVSSQEIKVGLEPKAIAFSADGCLAVVHNSHQPAIFRVDPNRLQVFGEAWPISPSAQVRGLELQADPKLGKLLFLLLADDTREQIARVSCPAR
jgi:DNA-binding beta-propeller fold protein YncE